MEDFFAPKGFLMGKLILGEYFTEFDWHISLTIIPFL